MDKLRSVLIMAGGTGGHVFPGIAVAKLLQEQGITVHWLGTQKGLESRLVPEAGIPISFISIGGLRGKNWREMLLGPWRLLLAIRQSMKIIRQFNPDIVLGMGGFVSGPGGIACWLLRRPLIIHEQNAKPGLTNQWLARIAKKVLEGFPNTFVNRNNVITTGNPVRLEIAKLAHPTEKVPNSPLHLLIVGGSLGAVAINQLVPQALANLPEAERPLVWHQTGEKTLEDTRQAYETAGISAKVEPFIKEMDKAYAWADIVLCRAGALTIAELCAAGVGAILVPYPYAVDDHQTANAQFMAKNNAAWLIQQADLTVDGLAALLKELYKSQEKCVAMAKSAYQLRKIDATETILRICEEVSQ